MLLLLLAAKTINRRWLPVLHLDPVVQCHPRPVFVLAKK
jgi:hypothetical protein